MSQLLKMFQKCFWSNVRIIEAELPTGLGTSTENESAEIRAPKLYSPYSSGIIPYIHQAISLNLSGTAPPPFLYGALTFNISGLLFLAVFNILAL